MIMDKLFSHYNLSVNFRVTIVRMSVHLFHLWWVNWFLQQLAKKQL